MSSIDFSIPNLGECKVASPIKLSKVMDDFIANYVNDRQFIIYDLDAECDGEPITRTYQRSDLMEQAGPREHIYFDPSKVCAGIVTCGGLCPGLNDVIRSIVMTLWHHYGVRNIHGIRYGYQGFLPENEISPIRLDPQTVSNIHRSGGTMLGSSRGGGDRVEDILDAIERMNLNVLFTIGGDGTQKGALRIARAARERGRCLAVIGVPKTIDNDLSFVQRSFGFETAVSLAAEAVSAAHVEAVGSINGIGLVKVMGRESGFIAAYTTLAVNEVNFVLVPEVPFDLEQPNGLLAHVEQRIKERGHAVILVAEGAGQGLLEAAAEVDASGNKKLGDIGVFLRKRLLEHGKRVGLPLQVRYIDPSYTIRSAPANPNDSVYCARLGANAVHAAMAGKTEMLVSLFNNHYVHVPMALSTSRRNYIDPESPLWRDVMTATGQPPLMLNR
ncbi:MAG: ATP-dependent 6-phosphofructokinase [Myxococcota bacterium]|jgi:6-phosphofructokinase 1|nr:ATP-dependent 6-phosphofructokinase [Myxococcota bacterium]